MMDHLKREHAPILEGAWTRIDEEAMLALKPALVVRRVVDFNGPLGWNTAAVNLGTMQPLGDRDPHVSVRMVQPFIELRVPILLDLDELDSVARGDARPDLKPVTEACLSIADLENRIVLGGLEAARVRGIRTASAHEPVTLGKAVSGYVQGVVRAMRRLEDAGIGGPYGLLMGGPAYDAVFAATEDGYPVIQHIRKQLVDGPILRVPRMDHAVLLSLRGGDFELHVGQDLAIGYAGRRDGRRVELFVTETFAFRLVEPAAAVVLQI